MCARRPRVHHLKPKSMQINLARYAFIIILAYITSHCHCFHAGPVGFGNFTRTIESLRRLCSFLMLLSFNVKSNFAHDFWKIQRCKPVFEPATHRLRGDERTGQTTRPLYLIVDRRLFHHGPRLHGFSYHYAQCFCQLMFLSNLSTIRLGTYTDTALVDVALNTIIFPNRLCSSKHFCQPLTTSFMWLCILFGRLLH